MRLLGESGGARDLYVGETRDTTPRRSIAVSWLRRVRVLFSKKADSRILPSSGLLEVSYSSERSASVVVNSRSRSLRSYCRMDSTCCPVNRSVSLAVPGPSTPGVDLGVIGSPSWR